MTFYLRLATAMVVGAAAGAFSYLELSSRTHHSAVLVIALSVAIGLGGGVDPAARAITSELGELSVKTKAKLAQPLWALISSIDAASESTRAADPPEGEDPPHRMSMTWRDVAITILLVRRTRFHLLRGLQVHVTSAQARGRPHPTTVRWSWKKGLPGECWEYHQIVRGRLTSRYEPYRRYTRKQWRAESAELRQRLSIHDVREMADLGYVEVHPIFDGRGGQYRGCLVVQVDEEMEPDMVQPEVQDLIKATSEHLGNLVSR